MIESSVGNTIRQIFDFQGEEYFRDLETNVLITLKIRCKIPYYPLEEV